MKNILLLIILFSSAILYAQQPSGVKRIAVIIGANDGGTGRAKLKYAVSDANSFSKVMTDMGALQKNNMVLLFDPDIRNIVSAFRKIKQTAEQSKDSRVEFFFYYSGHSDEEGLLLANEKLQYSNLKNMIKDIPAEVRIAVLDSCSSGAFTRIKGGKSAPSFLLDTSNDMKGNAFITSSSSDEVSQESDKINGSFFTHYLVSGMRGAADVSQDKKITLNEIYQYAYSETLGRTQKTMGGPQHPNYHIEMSGTGDIILTDVSSSKASIVIDDLIYGTVYVRKADNNILAAEIKKQYGRETTIGLEPGNYSITNDSEEGISEAFVTIKNNQSIFIEKKKMIKQEREKTSKRGDDDSSNYIVETNTLFDYNNFKYSGYGAVSTHFKPIGNQYGFVSGGRGGLIINDSFVLGGAGYGLVNSMNTKSVFGKADSDEEYFRYGSGGFMMEYYHSIQKKYFLSVGLITGFGELYYSEKSKMDEDYDRNNGLTFFSPRVEINGIVNVFKFFRLGCGAGYERFFDVSQSSIDYSKMNGFSGHIIFAFGWF